MGKIEKPYFSYVIGGMLIAGSIWLIMKVVEINAEYEARIAYSEALDVYRARTAEVITGEYAEWLWARSRGGDYTFKRELPDDE